MCPSFHPMRNSVSQRAAVLPVSPLQWARDAYEFNFQFIALGADYGIAVPAHIDERKMRSELRISFTEHSTRIAGTLQREPGAHAMHHREVYGWLNLCSCRWLGKINRSQRMTFQKRILCRFEQAGR